MPADLPEDVRILVAHAVANLAQPMPTEGKVALCLWLLDLVPGDRRTGDAERIGRAVADWVAMGLDPTDARALASNATGVDRREVKRAHRRHQPKPDPDLLPDVAVRDFCELYLEGEPIEALIFTEGVRYQVDRPTRQGAEAIIWRLLSRDYLARLAARKAAALKEAKGKVGRPTSKAGKAAAEAETYEGLGWSKDEARASAATMHGVPVKQVAEAIRNIKKRRKKK